jgi:hypothetical protein
MHDFHFGYTESIWEQPWKVSTQKTDLFRRNDFLSACTHQKCSKNELFSEVNFRHPAVLKASQNVNGLTKKDEFSVIL